MNGLWREIEERFAFRRAFRFGSVSTADFKEAFGMNLKTAERRLMECLAPARMDLKNLLCKEGRLLRPSPATLPPDFASEADLACALRNLQGGVCEKLFFALTGLREGEVGAPFSAPKSPLVVPGILTAFVKAIRARAVVEVSCSASALPAASIEGRESSMGEKASLTGTSRQAVLRVVPVAVQFAGDQLRVSALIVAEHNPQTHQWIGREEMSVFSLSAFSFAAPCLDARFRPVIHKKALPALVAPVLARASTSALNARGIEAIAVSEEGQCPLTPDEIQAPKASARVAIRDSSALDMPTLYGRPANSMPQGSRVGNPLVLSPDAPIDGTRPNSIWR